LQKSINYL